MPGGKNNIKPSDGKQFSQEYQPKEKWTEEKALELGESLVQWLNEVDEDGNDVGNIFFEEYIVIKRNLYPEVQSYLSSKFSSFFKLLEKAKKTQEIKLVKYGVGDRLNASMTKFVLANNHGYMEKKEITGALPVRIDLSNATDDDLDVVAKLMGLKKEDS